MTQRSTPGREGVPAARLRGRREDSCPRTRSGASHATRVDRPRRSASWAARSGSGPSVEWPGRSTTSPPSSLEIYAARESAARLRFSPDTNWQTEMEDAFPYDGDAGPGRTHRRGQGATWSAAGRWTGWSAATWATARPRSRCAPRSRRCMDGKQVAVLVPDDGAGPAALPHLPRAVRGVPGHGRGAVALPHAAEHRTRSSSGVRGRRRSTSSSARTGCCRRTCTSRTWACWSSTRSSASASKHKERLKQLRTRRWTC